MDNNTSPEHSLGHNRKSMGVNMSVIQVGLVDKTGKLDPDLVQATAAALNVQVLRDLTQFWLQDFV
jgi:hypothetical protein